MKTKLIKVHDAPNYIAAGDDNAVVTRSSFKRSSRRKSSRSSTTDTDADNNLAFSHIKRKSQLASFAVAAGLFLGTALAAWLLLSRLGLAQKAKPIVPDPSNGNVREPALPKRSKRSQAAANNPRKAMAAPRKQAPDIRAAEPSKARAAASTVSAGAGSGTLPDMTRTGTDTGTGTSAQVATQTASRAAAATQAAGSAAGMQGILWRLWAKAIGRRPSSSQQEPIKETNLLQRSEAQAASIKPVQADNAIQQHPSACHVLPQDPDVYVTAPGALSQGQ